MTQASRQEFDTQTEETFQERMQAQCEQICCYRWEVLCNEGRRLSYNEAALEWIERYAEDFARAHDPH